MSEPTSSLPSSRHRSPRRMLYSLGWVLLAMAVTAFSASMFVTAGIGLGVPAPREIHELQDAIELLVRNLVRIGALVLLVGAVSCWIAAALSAATDRRHAPRDHPGGQTTVM